ncbi:ferritin-like domain-containing protein [Bacillus carboniphilus]|uniref:Ferritin-like domain-containing protein n=1 Tax=Bacillus carboniphilus TaxID=86663 RepID=A0ABY9JWN4_9BACI|nr:ferritin-like domain-containing protein [Bacillus carboniphilus]WLR43214.1 ferritin-like domain-containing protein [Bacillus carboniphilus]
MQNKAGIEQVVYGLNIDLAWEYAAAVQYAQHANMLKGAAYFTIAEELNEHAKDEFGHAIILNELIQYLGGIPMTQVAPVSTSLDNIDMLRQDLQGEYDAIHRYLQRINQLESLGMYDSSEKIREIATQEQEHAIDLEMALGIEKTIIPAPTLSFDSN